MKSCQYCGAQYSDDVVTCAADEFSLDPSPREEASATGSAPIGIRCPACGAQDCAPAVELRDSFSLPVILAGGILALLFRNAGRRRKLRCNKCGELFEICTPLSKVSVALFRLLICPTIAGLVILLFALLYTLFSH